MRVLIAIEPRAYSEVIGEAIQGLRPCVELTVAQPEEIRAEVVRREPALVICGEPDTLSADVPIWVQFRPYCRPAARIRVGDRRSELQEVGLGDLLSVIDEITAGTHAARDERLRPSRRHAPRSLTGLPGNLAGCPA